MEKLQELIKRTKCSLSISINDHRNYYETIDEFITGEDREEINDEVFSKMVELNTCIRLQIYPNTPVGFYVIHHYDLEAAIDIALNEIKE